MARKLRRAEEKLIPQSTRADSFKRLLGIGRTGTKLLEVIADESRLRVSQRVEPEIVVCLIALTERRMFVGFAECCRRAVRTVALQYHAFSLVRRDGLLDHHRVIGCAEQLQSLQCQQGELAARIPKELIEPPVKYLIVEKR